ncbi:hypothetical protein MLD38_004965 [Melastoma candidum]|uniref:Uncharacterized protein n=1 Tax=Melastoma candidum TaxID=119954 RepID=A0ACB9S8N8_9MYRT|nr:hypothetical protein MLD38_004965 [Melastoma candidum]
MAAISYVDLKHSSPKVVLAHKQTAILVRHQLRESIHIASPKELVAFEDSFDGSDKTYFKQKRRRQDVFDNATATSKQSDNLACEGRPIPLTDSSIRTTSRVHQRCAINIWEEVKEMITQTPLEKGQTIITEAKEVLNLFDGLISVDTSHARALIMNI